MIIKDRSAQWSKLRYRHFFTICHQVVHLLFQFAPGLTADIQGLADCFDWSFEQAIREFSGYYLEEERSGCSIMTGTDFLVRNYDSHPSSYEGRLVVYQPTDGGYASIGPSMQIDRKSTRLNSSH